MGKCEGDAPSRATEHAVDHSHDPQALHGAISHGEVGSECGRGGALSWLRERVTMRGVGPTLHQPVPLCSALSPLSLSLLLRSLSWNPLELLLRSLLCSLTPQPLSVAALTQLEPAGAPPSLSALLSHPSASLCCCAHSVGTRWSSSFALCSALLSLIIKRSLTCTLSANAARPGSPWLADTRHVDTCSAKSSLSDAKSSLGDAKSSLDDAKSSLGDAKSSLGDAKSSLDDAKGRRSTPSIQR
jgi:hypothetical protein